MRTEYLAVLAGIFCCTAGVGAGLVLAGDGMPGEVSFDATCGLTVQCHSDSPDLSWSAFFSAVSASDRSVLHFAYPEVPLEGGVVIPVVFPDIEQIFGRNAFISVFGTEMLSRL